MDNQLASNEIQHLVKRIALVTLAISLFSLLAISGLRQFQVVDPYIKTVLARNGDRIQGQAIFQMNCAVCHVQHFDTQIGPSLYGVSQRKSEISLIKQVISGKTPPMPQFQPNPQEMADLLSYLQQI
ncbi:MAG TPA: cytochrome c [Kamptonema sp.]|nr:cytochrome c [Kamptonema sp.]